MSSRRVLQLKDKLAIIKETQLSGNIRAIARKYNIRPHQIRCWRRKQNQMLKTMKKNPKAKMINKINSQDVQHQLLTSLKELQDIAINTKKFIAAALSMNAKEEEIKVEHLIDKIDGLNIQYLS